MQVCDVYTYVVGRDAFLMPRLRAGGPSAHGVEHHPANSVKAQVKPEITYRTGRNFGLAVAEGLAQVVE